MNRIRKLLYRNKYKRNSMYRKDIHKLIAGTAIDRLSGLEPLFADAKGISVLDIGCHDGSVAQCFMAAGAARIDGCDISQRAIDQAKKKLQPYPSRSHFYLCDLSKGSKALECMDLLPRYEIVCYLGVHHHLKKQMTPRRYEALITAIADKTNQILVARTPLPNHATLERSLRTSGMVPTGDPAEAKNPKIGALRFYVPTHRL